MHQIIVIVRSKFFFLFIGREPTMWPANNCLRIMVCSCAMLSNSVGLQIIFCSCLKETMLLSLLRSLMCENGRLLCFPRIFIKKTNLVIKWWDNCYWTRLSQNIVICQCIADQYYYLPQPLAAANNWSVRHRQITIFCSTSSNNC